MPYQKPLLVELGAKASRVKGIRPLSCVSGGSASSLETCAIGNFPGRHCLSGNVPAATGVSCASGGATSYGDCIGGSAVDYYCQIGTSGGSDPYGCNSGPMN